MAIIHCLTCTASLTTPDTTTANELAAANNWLSVKVKGVDGYLCDGCVKWINEPIRVRQDQEPEYFEIKKSKSAA